MSVKYYIPFHDEDNNPCKIEFDITGYDGDPIKLGAVADPLTLSYNGEPGDLFQPIITSKASIRLNYDAGFLSDTRDIDDKDVAVNITYGSGYKWVGFLIADLRAETFDKTGYDVEVTCVDPFSYLKENKATILSGKYYFGRKSLSDIVTNVVSESINLPVSVQSGYKPLVEGIPVDIAGLFKDVYLRIETFIEDGLMISGYDIIESICNTLCLTSFCFNGAIYFRNARHLAGAETKKIGINDRVKPEFLIFNSEQITRTAGIKQLGISFPYTDNYASRVLNSNFYFADPTKPIGEGLQAWDHTPLADVSIIQPQIKKDDYRGIIIKGLGHTGSINGPWTAPALPTFLQTVTDIITDEPYPNVMNNFFNLNLKYKYKVYNKSGSQPNIMYAFGLYAILNNGDIYGINYEGEGGAGDILHSNWVQQISSTTGPLTLIQFPLDSSESENEFNLTISTNAEKAFPLSGAGSYSFMVILWPVCIANINGQYYNDHASDEEAIPDEINILECSITADNSSLSDITSGTLLGRRYFYSKDETNIRNNKSFKETVDTIEVKAGNKQFKMFVPAPGKTREYPSNKENGVLTTSDGTAIEKFTNGVNEDKLLTLNAKDRMYFLRTPRNMIDLELRSSQLSFTDVLEFPGVIGGKYIQLSDEYNVERCEHHLNVMELSGYDDQNDIIENYLSSE